MAFQPHFPSGEKRPMLLKDFLRDDGGHSYTPPQWSTLMLSRKSNKPHLVLLRSWSRRAAATKLSAVHKVVKLLQFATMKSPRGISGKLTKRSSKGNDDILPMADVSEVKVKVKDILRWRSFRDLAEDDPTPSDFQNTATSKRRECDFTAEELPRGENEELIWGKRSAVPLKNRKGDWSFEEYEQQSPVSVLDSPFRQVQRSKCFPTRRTLEPSFRPQTPLHEEVNEIEEKAKQLLSHIQDSNHDQIILDFFINELSINGKLDDDEFDCKTLKIAESWIDGEFEESYEWEVEDYRETYVKDMERGVCWNKFREEQEELCEELESRVLNDLIDDLVAGFLAARI